TAKEALDWGFVDEITDLEDEPAPRLTDALASAMANVGMPIPNIPLAETDRDGLFGKFLTAIASLFKPSSNPISTAMIKTYTFLSAILADKPLTVSNGTASVTAEQLEAIENALADKDKTVNEQKAALEAKDADIKAKDATIADLQAKLAAKPAASTTTVVEQSKPGEKTEPKTEAEAYCETVNSARKLYNLV
ncbi:MAG: hypothetical protein ACI4US_00695, partial [Muribaculaceae bacterium]